MAAITAPISSVHPLPPLREGITPYCRAVLPLRVPMRCWGPHRLCTPL